MDKWVRYIASCTVLPRSVDQTVQIKVRFKLSSVCTCVDKQTCHQKNYKQVHSVQVKVMFKVIVCTCVDKQTCHQKNYKQVHSVQVKVMFKVIVCTCVDKQTCHQKNYKQVHSVQVKVMFKVIVCTCVDKQTCHQKYYKQVHSVQVHSYRLCNVWTNKHVTRRITNRYILFKFTVIVCTMCGQTNMSPEELQTDTF